MLEIKNIYNITNKNKRINSKTYEFQLNIAHLIISNKKKEI